MLKHAVVATLQKTLITLDFNEKLTQSIAQVTI